MKITGRSVTRASYAGGRASVADNPVHERTMIDLPRVPSCSSAAFVLAFMLGCGHGNEPKTTAPMASSPSSKGADCNKDDYTPAAAWSGRKPALPAPPPETSSVPDRDGESFTVAGAIHTLRGRYSSDEVTRGDVTIAGYIVDTNIPRAPKCAIHRTGKRDPDNCDSELPTFVLADTRDASAEAPRIRVVGWARNFAAVYEAQLLAQSSPASAPFKDDVFGVDVPRPLPGVGAKVKVRGRYGFTFTKSSRGVLADPKSGVMTYAAIEYLEPAKPAVLTP